MLRRDQHFRDRTYPFETDIWWWIFFQEIQIQTRRLCDRNRLHWEGHCHQQSRFLTLTPLLQTSLLTQRPLPVVVVSKMCVASWSVWFTTALFGVLRLSLTFFGECFGFPWLSKKWKSRRKVKTFGATDDWWLEASNKRGQSASDL